MRPAETFHQVVSAAVRDFALHGFDSDARLQDWVDRIRRAAALSMTPPEVLERELRRYLGNVYARLVERGQALKVHRGVPRFTLENVRPALRQELDRRVAASANLIRLNREEAVSATLRRFSGWATSVPSGGSDAVEVRQEGATVRKALASLDFVQRRVLIDQGHKLSAAIGRTIAEGGGALAAEWHSNWRQPGYQFRPDHKERDRLVYLLRPSWALDRGLVKKGPTGYYDEVTAAGEEPFCRCYIVWLYHLRDLPEEMLTARGRQVLDQARRPDTHPGVVA